MATAAALQLNNPERYEKLIKEQRRRLVLIQQGHAFEDVEQGRLSEKVTPRCDKHAHPHHHRSNSRHQGSELFSSSLEGSSLFSYLDNNPSNGHRSINHWNPIAPIKEIVLCQCCFEETAATTTTTATFTDVISSHFTCQNPATPHHICTTCVTRYVRSWLHGASAAVIDSSSRFNYTGGRLLCFCSLNCNSGGDLCTSFLKVKDWNTILTPPEVVQVKERLHGGGNSWRSGGNKRVAPPVVVKALVSTIYPSVDSPPRASLPILHPPSCEKVILHVQLNLSRADSFGRTARNESRQQMDRQIEEMKTGTKVRSCPNCDRTFLKESGCNKMKCPTCHTTMCYCCRLVIPQQGYDHFFVQGREESSSGQCPLWTDETIDRQQEAHLVKQRLFAMFQQLR